MSDRQLPGRLEELFATCLSRPAEERSAWLDRECGEDRELFAAVSSLLEHHLDSSTEESLELDATAAARLLEPEVFGAIPAGGEIGRYRLLEEIGRGGAGVVYKAERSDGAFDQIVALKLLHPGSSGLAERRFEQERRILAGLVHANIARLIDGGLAASDRPYLVVEYVEGLPIDEYCRQHDIDVKQRVEMLADLCSAVHTAHQRLVVHRDIKPGNILVKQNGEAQLLDFGIAKLLEEGGALDLTRTHQGPMTVQYASPEQVRGEPVAVASDVYQLGLVAYEVLSGERPYRLEGAALASGLSRITETEPPPPSRRAEPAHRRQLRGDLDTIVLKALRKSPEQRYSSAQDLERDFRRYLEGRPIEARPSTWTYRLSRWISRNRMPVAVGAAAALLLLASSLAFTLRLVSERDRSRAAARLAEERRLAAEQAQEEAEKLLEFLWNTFDNTSPQFTGGEPITAPQLLAAARSDLDRQEFESAATRASLLSALGTLYRRYGDLESARDLQREALAELDLHALEEIATEVVAEKVQRHGDAVTDPLWELSRIEAALGEPARREHWLRLLDPATASRWGASSSRYAQVLVERATSALRLGEVERARALITGARTILEANHGAEHPAVANALIRQALVEERLGNYRSAMSLLLEALPTLEEDSDELPNLAMAYGSLAQLSERLGDVVEALSWVEETDRIARRVHPPGHPGHWTGSINRGLVLRKLGRYEEAEAVLTTSLNEMQETGVTVAKGSASAALASVLAESGRSTEAIEHYDFAIEDFVERSGADSVEVAIQRNNRGEAHLANRGLAAAERDFTAAREIFEERLSEDHFFLSYPLLNLSLLLGEQGDWVAASSLAERAFEIRESVQGTDGEDTQEALRTWIEILQHTGDAQRLERARSLLSKTSD